VSPNSPPDPFDRFVRSLKSAFNPIDVHTPRRLWGIRILALIAIVYSCGFALHGESRPINEILLFGGLALLMLTSELKKVWDRVERKGKPAPLGH
jgi:hypothetical protein